MIGSAGLATDTIQWSLWHRQLQRSADSAALAGAYAHAQNASVDENARKDLARTLDVALSASAVIENAPTRGAYAGNTKAVRVSLRTQRPLPFSSIFMATAPVIQAEATALETAGDEFCLLALDRASAGSITISGNTTLNLNCGMAANSASNQAIQRQGSGSVVASPIASVGGLNNLNGIGGSVRLQPYSIPIVDPFKGLPQPAPTDCGDGVSVGPGGVRILLPGCYRGFDVKGALTLLPGAYYIDGESLTVGSQGILTGVGVTIILTSSETSFNPGTIATAKINGGATIKLSAPLSGPYKGVLLYQDPRALDTGRNMMNGNAVSNLNGAVYFPSQELEYSGTSEMTTTCVRMVAKRFQFTGNSTLNNSCVYKPGFTSVRVRLVE